METSVPEIKKSRKPNWGDREMDVLAEAVYDNLSVIKGKFSPGLTNEKKNSTWAKITEKVNAVTVGCTRTLEEVKKRWQDAQSSVKKKENIRQKDLTATGGGPHSDVHYKQWELIVLRTLSSIAVNGINGAIDTSAPKNNGNCSKKVEDTEASVGLLEDSFFGNVQENTITIPVTPMPSETAEIPSLMGEAGCGSSTSTNDFSTDINKQTTRRKSQSDVDVPLELLNLKRIKMENELNFQREILNIEREKLQLLREISHALKHGSSLSVSPVIQFT